MFPFFRLLWLAAGTAHGELLSTRFCRLCYGYDRCFAKRLLARSFTLFANLLTGRLRWALAGGLSNTPQAAEDKNEKLVGIYQYGDASRLCSPL